MPCSSIRGSRLPSYGSPYFDSGASDGRGKAFYRQRGEAGRDQCQDDSVLRSNRSPDQAPTRREPIPSLPERGGRATSLYQEGARVRASAIRDQGNRRYSIEGSRALCSRPAPPGEEDCRSRSEAQRPTYTEEEAETAVGRLGNARETGEEQDDGLPPYRGHSHGAESTAPPDARQSSFVISLNLKVPVEKWFCLTGQLASHILSPPC